MEPTMIPTIRRPGPNRVKRFPSFIVASFAFVILLCYSFLLQEDNTMLSQSKVVEFYPPHIEYKLVVDELSSDHVLLYTAHHKVRCQKDDEESMPMQLQLLTIEGWIRYMTGNHSNKLALELTNLVKACPFQGIRFETKGTNAENAKNVPFEFVLVNDDSLYNFASDADPRTFAQKLKTCPDNPHACVFSNLGGDATLVSPKDEADGDKDRYGHLAAFLRKATTTQIQGVWKLVAETYQQQLAARSPNTVWFSTAGDGVAWLHFRLDKRPKYYHYSPFKKEF